MQKQGSDESEYRRSGVHFRQGYLLSLLREAETIGSAIDKSDVLSTPLVSRMAAGADLALAMWLDRVRDVLAIEDAETGGEDQ